LGNHEKQTIFLVELYCNLSLIHRDIKEFQFGCSLGREILFGSFPIAMYKEDFRPFLSLLKLCISSISELLSETLY